ncbi:hypothetical protein [Micromonospora sp. NPDC047187]|uniref:hypothetical protein n=1 Tax=Micromonospora sp. NPDC047187 TaxID=3155262 RepID=UPI0033FAA8FD
MLTDRDIVVKVLAEGRDPATVTAGELAQGEAVTIGADDDAAEIHRTMGQHKFPPGAPGRRPHRGHLRAQLTFAPVNDRRRRFAGRRRFAYSGDPCRQVGVGRGIRCERCDSGV